MYADAVTRVVTSSLDFADNVVSLATEQQPGSRQAARVGRIVLDALSAAAAGSIVVGTGLETQLGLATTELVANVAVAPWVWSALVADLGEKATPVTWKDIARLSETIGADILRMIRAGATAQALEEMKNLEKIQKEGEGATRPVYVIDGEDFKQVGVLPIDKGECERAIASASAVSHTSQILETLVRNHVPSAVFGSVAIVTAAFAQFIRDQFVERGNQEASRPLRERDVIPRCFAEDRVLSQHICPITMMPIRHPVVDPATNTMYERFAIERWIDERGTSPLSNTPLRRESLVPAEETQRAIDAQLEALQGDYDRRTERMRRRLTQFEADVLNGDLPEAEPIINGGIIPAAPRA